MNRIALILAIAAGATACKDTEAAKLPAPTIEPVRNIIDSRTQLDLAAAIDSADDSDDPELAYARLRADWLDKRVQWKVYRIAPLCRTTDRCNVLPFDRAGKDANIVQGWMPRLELDDADMAAIADHCGSAQRCEIEIQGTISELVLSVEKPTSLAMSDIDVIADAAL